ncbi:ABC transporter substrate-binding protein [[Clostridium] aminophilum]|uniref:ABC transporter substrate-binding protein n=1 Tax=[Clostridium] aminophilum TaxID=1526 RepID=UPI0026F178CE|nr:ABC transporter substrate-binding protein [[Clostridium] aminophilum]MDD6195969.1 hypothetical protein [[Clostridium] aminophilum]
MFNRLVEMENDAGGNMVILPSLAKSWETSDDGRCYTFHLRDHVTFINDAREIRRMFENGEIDVLDLDEVGNAAEYFLHGDK